MDDNTQEQKFISLLRDKLFIIAQETMMEYGNISYELCELIDDSKYNLLAVVIYKNGMKNMTPIVDMYVNKLKKAIEELHIENSTKISTIGVSEPNDITLA